MTQVTIITENTPLVLQMSPVVEMTDDQFFEFCQLNRDLRIERTAEGKLIIVPPTSQVYVYRLPEKVQCLDNPSTLSGELILPEFALNLENIW